MYNVTHVLPLPKVSARLELPPFQLGYLPAEVTMVRSTSMLPSLGEEQLRIPWELIKDHLSSSL